MASASGLGPEGPVFESQYPDIETETDSPASVSVFIPPLPPERSRFCHPERSRFCHPERQRRIWSTTPVPAPANGPRTSTFCNPLRHSTIQNHFVRGPYFFEGITNNRFFATVYISIRYKFNLFAVRYPAPYCSMHLFSPVHISGDMHRDDAVESIYRGSAAHISTFLWRYAPRGCL